MRVIRRKFLIVWIAVMIALLSGYTQKAFSQIADSISLSDKVNRISSFAHKFRGEVWQNPALYYYHSPFSWTQLDVNGSYHDKGKASLQQEGDKDTRMGVDVHSFVILSERDRVFGSAGYRSEKQENVLWNENIDWKWVAPYVTGDSIGGFLKGETYYFNGGYALETGLWTLGVTGSYRASHNYRDKDPRPRNTASDLSFTWGAGYRLGNYRLGASADFRFYQQKSEITFLADKGSTSVYHMLGLGMDYVRFAGSQTGSKYQGIEWGGSISLLPVDSENGISATVSMNHLSMDKKLSSANNLTLLKAATTNLKGNATWMRTCTQAQHMAVKLDAAYHVRKGKENIYGEAGGNSYGALISTVPGIQITNYRMGIEGLWESLLTNEHTWGGAVLPQIAFHKMDMDYSSVSRYVRIAALESSLRTRLYYQKSLLKLTLEANGGYYANLSKEQSLPGLSTDKSSAQTLLANIDYLADSYSTVGIRLQGDYPIRKQINIYVSAQWQTAHYKKCGTTQYAACSLGFYF